MQSSPVLYPVPRQVTWGSGHVAIPAELVIVVTARQQELLPVVARFKEAVAGQLGISVRVCTSAAGLSDLAHVVLSPDSTAVTREQGYTLAVGSGQIRLDSQTAEGAAYGLATLKQLLLATGRRVPEVAIADWPDIARRGLMLDISRGKVPSMETLYRFVDLLADLKLNELQLYMEHTFAYREHPEVWQNASPMTGEEILLLDRYCRERFIDLVPNQNSFGHLTPWLIHDRYKHVAETHELLPHFSSAYFNVGCDETLDVGQGRSKAAVAEHGEHRIYVDHLLKIYEQVKARGKTMMFWGDIIVKAPEYIAELPKDVIAMEWGYEADHPFDVRCGREANRDADVVPFLTERLFADRSGQIGAVLRDLGNVYQSVGKLVFNGSLLGHLIQQGLAIRPKLMEGATVAGFDRAAAVIREIAGRLDGVQLGCEDAALVLRELRNAVRMLLHACSLGKFLLAGAAGGAAPAERALDLDAIIAEHRLLWLARNRIGGLEEMSLAPVRRVHAGYKELMARAAV